MSSPPPETEAPQVNMADAIAAAAERRSQAQPQKATAAQLAAEHERRQTFRRLLDPGILRPNSKEQYVASLKTLSTIAENLVKDPDNPKFQQFKPTNNVIKKNLVETKGALEYAIQLGFRPEVIKFQPYYTFNPRFTSDLIIGASILKEALNLEVEKQERAARGKVNQKAVDAEIARKVKLQYMDDRQSKQLTDEREKQLREIRLAAIARGEDPAAAAAAAPATPTRTSRSARQRTMPGGGQTLSGASPPPYQESEDTGMQVDDASDDDDEEAAEH